LQTNQFPSTQQKQQLAEYLGLPLRKVVVFFSNHRVRGFGKKTASAAVCDLMDAAISSDLDASARQQPEVTHSPGPKPEVTHSPGREPEMTHSSERKPDVINSWK
jgi:hypothetical protein